MSASEETLRLLTSMDASLKRLVRLLEGGAGASAAPTIASDTDLDSQWGNPVVKSMPTNWKGAPFIGRKYSECPAELLDLLAERHDYIAAKADERDERTNSGKPKSAYQRKDAARARGWAARVRAGHAPGAGASSTPARRAVPAAWASDLESDTSEDTDLDDDADPFASGEPPSAADIFGR